MPPVSRQVICLALLSLFRVAQGCLTLLLPSAGLPSPSRPLGHTSTHPLHCLLNVSRPLACLDCAGYRALPVPVQVFKAPGPLWLRRLTAISACAQAFQALGTTLEEHVHVQRVQEAAYRVFFAEDCSSLDLLYDETAMATQLEAIEPGAGARDML